MPIFNSATNLQKSYNAERSNYDFVIKSDTRGWSFLMRNLSEVAQNGFSDPGDVTAYMQKTRGFVTVGLTNAIVEINGERHVLSAGLTYCADPSEIQTMLVQSQVQNLGLTLGTLAAFIANPGIDSFYS